MFILQQGSGLQHLFEKIDVLAGDQSVGTVLFDDAAKIGTEVEVHAVRLPEPLRLDHLAQRRLARPGRTEKQHCTAAARLARVACSMVFLSDRQADNDRLGVSARSTSSRLATASWPRWSRYSTRRADVGDGQHRPESLLMGIHLLADLRDRQRPSGVAEYVEHPFDPPLLAGVDFIDAGVKVVDGQLMSAQGHREIAGVADLLQRFQVVPQAGVGGDAPASSARRRCRKTRRRTEPRSGRNTADYTTNFCRSRPFREACV